MTNDKNNRTYRLLLYYFENKIPVHFKLLTGEFRNGIILDLNENKYTLVLDEFVFGEKPFLLEEIDDNTISTYTEVGA